MNTTMGLLFNKLLGYIVLKLFNIYESFGSIGCILEIKFSL